jgi:D-3-phosphoglycerate dehydrogenase
MEIVILDSGYKSYAFEKELFEKNGFSLKIFPDYKGDTAEKRDFAKNADGILVRHTIIDETFLSGLKNLKAIARYGVGYDNVDIKACTRNGIKVANVQGYANHSVSDHALALIYSCSRAMWNTKIQLTQNFSRPPVPDIFELHDKTLGIIGIGRIGSELCRKASHLFKQVLACDPYKPDYHFDQLSAVRVGLEELLKNSDVISIHCNLNNETRHLLNKNNFRIAYKKPVLINTSRGEIIDEEALINALNSGTLHSAGLDVFENEPLTEKQISLSNHPRVICTGHYAWYSDKAAAELQQRAAQNLYNFLIGNPVEDCLNC